MALQPQHDTRLRARLGGSPGHASAISRPSITDKRSGYLEIPAEDRVLHGQNVRLRPFQVADAPELFAATCETSSMLCVWMTWCNPNYSLLDCRNFILGTPRDWEADAAYHFAIFDAKDDVLSGSISINHIDREQNSANVGYWVRTSKAGRGLATEALEIVSEFGLKKLNFDRLEIKVPEGNLASQRVALKAGAKPAGTLPDPLVIGLTLHKTLLFSFNRASKAISASV